MSDSHSLEYLTKRATQLTDNLRRAQGSAEHQALLELLRLKLEQAKHQLVTCSPQDFQRFQGEAQAYNKLIASMTTQPLEPKVQNDR